MRTIIVTRHPALLDLLAEKGIAPKDAEVLSHVRDPSEIAGARVIGNLPLHLAAQAELVVSVTLDIPPERRGDELTLEDLRGMYRGHATYRVLDRNDFGGALRHAQEVVNDLAGAAECANAELAGWGIDIPKL